MILLDSGHAMVRDIIAQRIGSDNENFRQFNPCEVTVADFDDVLYWVKCEGNSATILIHLPPYAAIESYGVRQYLDSVYGAGMVGGGCDVGGISYHVSLNFDIAEAPANLEEFLDKVSCLKRHCLAAPFHHVFKQISASPQEMLVSIPYRRDETLFLKGTKEGSVIVIFQIKFRDQNDLVIADVFMKDFGEVRREPGLSQAPSISFSKTAPLELKGQTVQEGADIAFISFALFARHFSSPEKADKSISSLINFRNELHYHIKCCKAFLHMRMRQRVSNLLQVLNRAKPDSVGGEKKTATGRTFVRK